MGTQQEKIKGLERRIIRLELLVNRMFNAFNELQRCDVTSIFGAVTIGEFTDEEMRSFEHLK